MYMVPAGHVNHYCAWICMYMVHACHVNRPLAILWPRSEYLDKDCDQLTEIEQKMAREGASKADLESTSGPSASWTVSQLREFLKVKGGRLPGKESELVER